jgi:hypothetical protein
MRWTTTFAVEIELLPAASPYLFCSPRLSTIEPREEDRIWASSQLPTLAPEFEEFWSEVTRTMSPAWNSVVKVPPVCRDAVRVSLATLVVPTALMAATAESTCLPLAVPTVLMLYAPPPLAIDPSLPRPNRGTPGIWPWVRLKNSALLCAKVETPAFTLGIWSPHGMNTES